MIAVVLAPTALPRFASQYANLCGVRHHIRDTGEITPDGPVAVLLHGFAGSTEAWDRVGPLLAESGCRAIAFDRVGFGRTERPAPPVLPAPPALPFADALASAIESSVGSESSAGASALLPDPRKALAIGLRKPAALAPRLDWRISQLGDDPYSTQFAVRRATFELLRQRVGPSAAPRKVFLVGHSAGGPLALRALLECAKDDALPRGATLAGVALLAPASLDPREDADCFDVADDEPGLLDGVPLLPDDVRRRAELEARFAAFRGVVSLPDAFGLQTARRIYEGRDLEEAVRGQMHPRMRAPEYASRVSELADKYSLPIREFPDDWDSALLNVYRADQPPRRPLSGRALLAEARAAKERGGARILVATGDADGVVAPRASARVAELLGADEFTTMAETGHLPMDERPEETAKLLLDFFEGA